MFSGFSWAGLVVSGTEPVQWLQLSMEMKSQVKIKALKGSTLRSGDCLGIFAPASPVRPECVEKGRAFLARSGFVSQTAKNLYDRLYHLAGSCRNRLADLERLLLDPQVKGLLAARGGYGCLPLLPLLDYALFARYPKIIIGGSDLTSLQLALWGKIGLITFSGPMLAVEMARPGMVNSELLWGLTKGLAGASSEALLSPYLESEKIIYLRPGVFSGVCLGGTLTLISSLAGTGFLPDFAEKIIFLEDRGESLYRIDRALTQLRLAGVFASPAAVVCGNFDLPAPAEEPLLRDFLRDFFAGDDFPVLIGFQYGHCSQSFIFPQGGDMKFDCRERKITLLETAVD